MILERVNSPQDLKRLNISELKILAQELRDLIIEVVSKKGGHLASSLGAVELCIALHYCLDTPYDSVIFDVGHQCYAHKIITGRRKDFYRLREYKGLSGFPNPSESEYDLFISGHASTALSWAVGLAEAKRMKNNRTKTVAIIGDGSLTGGMCFEALNMCGHNRNDILLILNHNEMSISPSVGALSSYLTKIISAPIYNRIKDELEKFLRHSFLGKKLAHHAKKFEEALKGLIIPGVFFEELGFRYFGPIDGHNLEVLVSTLKNVLALRGPRLLHIITKKGKGYKFAEENPIFDHKKGSVLKEKKETFSEVFGKKILSLAQRDKRIVTITAAMPKGTGLNIFKEKFPERFFDVGIAESHAVGFASGLAKQGFKPVVAIYSTFLQRAFDQIIHDVALQNLGVIFAIDRAGIVGEDGPTHQGIFDIAYLRLIPNMVIMAPRDKEELEEMFEFALTLDSPVSIRYPKGEAYSLNIKREKVTLGKWESLKEGDTAAIVATGFMVKIAKQIIDSFEEEGRKMSLINARFIKPLDIPLLKKLASKFKYIFTMEEATLIGGLGSAILEFYQKNNLLEKTRVICFGLPDEFIPVGKREELLEIYGLNPGTLKRKIEEVLKQKILCSR
jgi:1-deoxy-D-xylulose-5-phosphate synthase